MRIPKHVIRYFLRPAIVLAAIFLSGIFGFLLPNLGSRITLPLLPSGLAVAATQRWGRRMGPAIFLGALAIDLYTGESIATAVGTGLGLAAGAGVAAWIMRRQGFDSEFSRARDVPVFIFASAIGMALAPTLGMLGSLVAGARYGGGEIAILWVRWWSDVTCGVLLLGPLLVAYRRRTLARFFSRSNEAALWLVGLVICCGSTVLAPSLGRPLVMVLAVVLTVVSSIRFGLVIAAAGAFAISSVAAYSLGFGRGVFAEFNGLQGLVTFWSFSVALSGLSLIVTALLAERDAAALETLRAERRYAEVFYGSPQPLWVHAGDTKRFLLVNEAAVRQYGWSREEMLGLTIEVLQPRPGVSVVAESPDSKQTVDPAAEPFETQHKTKDGGLLDVEVWTRCIDFGDRAAELVFAIDITERRAFGQALIDAIAGEQRRIGQEMHDGLGQELTGLALSVRALANRALKERDSMSVDLDQLALLASSCIQDAQRIVQGLSPLADVNGDLGAALDALSQRSSLSGTPVRFQGRYDAAPTVELKVKNHLFRIAQEAVQNSLRHSGANSVVIELHAVPGSLELSIVDDGRGVAPDAIAGAGLGMRTMRFRASVIGGKLSVGGGSFGGNRVACVVPMKLTKHA